MNFKHSGPSGNYRLFRGKYGVAVLDFNTGRSNNVRPCGVFIETSLQIRQLVLYLRLRHEFSAGTGLGCLQPHVESSPFSMCVNKCQVRRLLYLSTELQLGIWLRYHASFVNRRFYTQILAMPSVVWGEVWLWGLDPSVYGHKVVASNPRLSRVSLL